MPITFTYAGGPTMWTNDGPALYVADDGQTVVEEGDPRAAFLLVAAGAQLPIEEAEKYGLTEKARAAAANKAKTAPPNKSK